MAWDDKWLRDQIKILAIKADITPDEMAAIMGVSRAAYYNRLKNPDDFRRGELRRLDRLAERYGMTVMEGHA